VSDEGFLINTELGVVWGRKNLIYTWGLCTGGGWVGGCEQGEGRVERWGVWVGVG
jgi:hypothetical protein